jgi:GNAT superfamily N-acetyltransferase
LTHSSASLVQRLEDAAFAAWPAAHSSWLNGWLLRLDVGYTKRANSLNMTERAGDLSGADLDAVEQRFMASGLPPVIRVISRVSHPDTQALLARRGYRYTDASWVLHRPMAPCRAADQPRVALLPGATPWMSVFARLSGQSVEHAKAHQALLQRITHPVAWATLGQPSAPQCCGLGVLAGDQLGLFDIVTRSDHKRQGLAAQLCNDLLAWGQARGAQGAFLQVVNTNAPALALYEKLGFQPAYEYGYWVRG